MEGAITIPASVLWGAAGSLGVAFLGFLKWVGTQLEKRDSKIEALQGELTQKYKDDVEYYRRIEAERGNV